MAVKERLKNLILKDMDSSSSSEKNIEISIKKDRIIFCCFNDEIGDSYVECELENIQTLKEFFTSAGNTASYKDVLNLLANRITEIERQMIAKPFEGADEMEAIMELVKFYDKKIYN